MKEGIEPLTGMVEIGGIVPFDGIWFQNLMNKWFL